MITKPLIAISTLLAFTAISGLAYASPQPSDKAWWPNLSRAPSERPSATTSGVSQRSPNSARTKSMVVKPRPNPHRGPKGFY